MKLKKLNNIYNMFGGDYVRNFWALQKINLRPTHIGVDLIRLDLPQHTEHKNFNTKSKRGTLHIPVHFEDCGTENG